MVGGVAAVLTVPLGVMSTVGQLFALVAVLLAVVVGERWLASGAVGSSGTGAREMDLESGVSAVDMFR